MEMYFRVQEPPNIRISPAERFPALQALYAGLGTRRRFYFFMSGLTFDSLTFLQSTISLYFLVGSVSIVAQYQ